jgi:malate synthase
VENEQTAKIINALVDEQILNGKLETESATEIVNGILEQLTAENLALKAQVEVARKGLEKYADKRQWASSGGPHFHMDVWNTHENGRDIAAQALAEMDEKQEKG